MVDLVGSRVDDYKIGDRVFYHGDYRVMGTFAEYACITAITCCHLRKLIHHQFHNIIHS
jgi:NADPH:quinone reductase-like Zn-dependent oxidoreductase